MPNATARANAQAMPIDRRAALSAIAAAAGAMLAAPTTAAATGSGNSRSLAQEFEAAWAAERAVDAAFPYGEADEDAYQVAYDIAFGRSSAIVKRMIAEPAQDLESLTLKGRAYLWCYSNDVEEALGVLSDRAKTTDWQLLHSILRDLLALGCEA